MLGTLRAALIAIGRNRSLQGRHITRLCLVASLQQRPVRYSSTWGGLDPPYEVTTMEDEVEENLDKTYTPQQRDAILRLLNTASESQLDCVKELQGKKSAIIVQHREQYGPFPDLNALHRVQHLRLRSAQKLCDSILSVTSRADRRAMARFLKPDVPLHRLQEVESIVSIVFGLKKLAWVHMDRNMMVRDWQLRECFRFMKGKHQPEIYMEDISSVVSQMPQADLYILEKPAVSNQNTSLFPVALHLRTVEAMLYCLLNPRQGAVEGAEQRVFSMARNTVGKHFELMLKESRTSGVQVVQALIDQAVIVPKPRVTFASDLIQRYRHHFQARGQNRQEEMCDALLQAVTFYELTFF